MEQRIHIDHRRVQGAMEFAARAHRDQAPRQFTEEPYIFHPMRVADAVRGWGTSAMVVALLHDVIEDTDAFLHGRSLYGDGLFVLTPMEAVLLDMLTRTEDQTHAEYIERIAYGPELARAIKLADVFDNVGTLPFAHGLQKRYRKAIEKLTKKGLPFE